MAAALALVAGIGMPACATNESEGCTATGTCGGNDSASSESGSSESGRGDSGSTDATATDAAFLIPWDGQDPGSETGIGCDPQQSPHDSPCVIDEAYGVFVATTSNGGSDSTGDGSKARPYASIGRALTQLGSKRRVYICDGVYAESVTLQTAASLYGGLACQGDSGPPWSYDQGMAKLSAAQNQIPLRVSDAGAISIEDMWIVAANAAGQDDAGNGLSSMAALVYGSAVMFRRCAFNAGNGDNGLDGTSGVNYAGATAPAGESNDGGAGGTGGVAACGDGTSSTGGAGGSAQSTGGRDGGAVPMPVVMAPFDGLGAAGGSATCSNGDPGANGAPAEAGSAAVSYGTLLALGSALGWQPRAGGAGQSGRPGQGGGGAGGKSLAMMGGTGGGAGGCGGGGGRGGGGGGASIALACVGSTLTFDHCVLSTSAAGNGGNGGDGQGGQGGGAPPASVGVCAGGFGGNGAGGAGGAGGSGGISVCVVYQGNAPSGSFTCAHGIAGIPGSYGNGGDGGDNSPTQGNPGARGSNGADGGPGVGQESLHIL